MEFGQRLPEQRAAEDHGPKEGERRDAIRAAPGRGGGRAGWKGGAAAHKDNGAEMTVNKEGELRAGENTRFNQRMTGAELFKTFAALEDFCRGFIHAANWVRVLRKDTGIILKLRLTTS